MEYLLGLALQLWSQGHIQAAMMAVGLVLGLQTLPALRRRAKRRRNSDTVVHGFPVRTARAFAEDRLREDLENLRRIQKRMKETAALVSSMVNTADSNPHHERLIELLDEHDEKAS